jgi:hypothetical protein
MRFVFSIWGASPQRPAKTNRESIAQAVQRITSGTSHAQLDLPEDASVKEHNDERGSVQTNSAKRPMRRDTDGS